MSDSDEERVTGHASDDDDAVDYDEEEDENDVEEDEEEEEEEEEAARPSRPSKKRATAKKSSSRKRARNFFSDEAEVANDDDEEEEEEEEEGYYDERYRSEAAEAARAAREIDNRRRNIGNIFEEKPVQQIAEELEERYRQQHRRVGVDGGGEYEFVATEVTQQSLLPRSTDPSIWIVQCKPGSEQLIILSLMSKALDFKLNRGVDLGIKTAFATATKGYIYIESDLETGAREAVNGLNLVRQFTMKKLPTHEMTSVLTIRQTRKPLEAGQWARFKRGPYKGDLCKVLEVIEGGARVIAQVVPRLDYSKLKIPGARTLATTLNERYPQKFFSPMECRQAGGNSQRMRYPGLGQETCDFFEGNYFYRGYLLKEVKPDTTLKWEGVQPTITELQNFRDRKEKDDGEFDDDEVEAPKTANLLDELAQMTPASAVQESAAPKFQAGDMVQVISGDLINLTGKIKSIDEATGAITLQPNTEAFPGTVQVTADQLIKYIKIGAHVKVVGGVHAGNTGIVVVISELEGEYICVVLTDGLNTELKVNIADIVVSSEVTTGLSNLQGYELYDLVVLGQNETAVVTAVSTESLRVLTHHGIEKEIRPQELRGKRNLQSLRSTALDNVQNILQEGDIVTVVKGNFAKKTGTIKHISRGTLWLHSTSHHKNAGVFVVRARSCMLSGTRANAAVTNMRSSPAMRQGAGMVARQANEFKNATVRILRGPHKGLIGHVADANETHLRVELHSKLKKVMIEIGNVQKVGDKQGGFDSAGNSAAPMSYPMGIPDTPAMIAETPRNIPDTPLHMAETPSHDAMPYTPNRPTTPGHDVWRPSPVMPASNPMGDYGGFRASTDQAFLPVPSSYGSISTHTGSSFQAGYSSRPYSHSPYGESPSLYTPSYGEGFSPSSTPLSQTHVDVAPSEWPKSVVLVFKSGPEVGSEAVLVENLGDNMKVRMPNGRMERVAARDLAPANPQKKDNVIVLTGSFKGLTGTLKKFSSDLNVDDTDAYIKPSDGSAPVVIPKLYLGKLAD